MQDTNISIKITNSRQKYSFKIRLSLGLESNDRNDAINAALGGLRELKFHEQKVTHIEVLSPATLNLDTFPKQE